MIIIKYIIGIDGGGTKTAFEAYGYDGTVLYSVSGASNYNYIGIDSALANINHGIMQLGVDSEDITAISLGDPSIDDIPRSESSLLFVERLTENFPHSRIFVRSDAFMALYAATGGNAGISIISGTGAMAIACGKDGSISFSGGWGRITGDEGSGYEIAQNGIKAALRYCDGIDEPTMLLDALLEYCGCSEPRQLIDVMCGDNFDITPFSALVDECSAKGDKTATGILRLAGQHLFELADSLARRCRLSGSVFTVGITGSVIEKNRIVREEFETKLKAAYPECIIRVPEATPQHAAVLYAKEQMNIL